MEFAGSCQNPTSKARGAGTYIYTPLEEERSIRLIRLHPATDPDTPLRCTITTRPLANGVSFEALSYQWGDPDRTHTLFCDNVPLGITTSLYKALINLRPKDTYALFWADAVCINQDDLTEKATQVTFMAEIYKAAQRTVVYLGDQSDDTALAIKSLKQIATICMEASGERFDHINRVVDEETQIFLDRVDHARMNTLYTSDERILAAFRTFFDHGWWNRIWVIQEVCLGNDPLVICGQHTIPWGAVVLASTWMARKAPSLMLWEHQEVPLRMGFPCVMHLNILKSDAMDPSSLFRTAALFQATDPRDKVYALVAFESLNFHRFWRIRVDYKLTTAQVYCQATAGCILQSKGLNILYHIHHGDTKLDEPFSTPGRSLIEGEFATWVPQLKGVHYSNAFAWEERWTAHGELVTAFEEDDAEYQKFHVRGVEPSRHGNHEHVPPHYHTSQVVSAIQCPRDSSIKTLKVRGIQVDVSISGSMPLNPAWWDPKHKNFTPVLLSLLNDMQVSRQPDLESQTTMERAQGILSSILQATIEDDDTSRNQLRLYWSYVVNVVKTMRGKTLPPDFYNTFPGLTSLTEEQMRQGEEWVARVQQYACYRRVFRTCRGIWGNGPSSMRANDFVVVVYGIIVPLVLRPSGDKWQLVGTCYLHGYMHGLAVEEFKMGKLEMQVFEIE